MINISKLYCDKAGAADESKHPSQPSNKVVVWTGKICLFVSILMFVVILLSYFIRPDYLAALTFFPPWVWGFTGLAISLFILLYHKYYMIGMALGWIIFIAIFAEEPKSLLRGAVTSLDYWQKIPQEKKLVVISLNCAGGNLQAAREVLEYNPDIILLQESPTEDEIKLWAQNLFNNHTVIVHGLDATIIARGELEQVPMSKPVNVFMTQASIRLQTGQAIQVASIRLNPPVIDENLLSLDCWRKHWEDRKSRRKQLVKAIEQLDYIHKGQPAILGGDFNVSANDGCLDILRIYLKDVFTQSGIGWGHTAINNIPLFRVDQVWASSHFRPVCGFARETKHSDHRMVICYMVLE